MMNLELTGAQKIVLKKGNIKDVPINEQLLLLLLLY